MNKKQSKVMRSFQIRIITQLGQGTFESINIKNPVFSRWLVGYLADNNIPFQAIPLGEGVTRIIKSGDVCPYCNGKGFTHADTAPVKNLLTTNYYEEVKDVEEHNYTSCHSHVCSCNGGCKDGGDCCCKKDKAA